MIQSANSLACAALLFSLAACVAPPAPHSMVPTELNGGPVEVIYSRGEAAARIGDSGGCAVYANGPDVTLWVAINNTTSETFLFDPTEVAVTYDRSGRATTREGLAKRDVMNDIRQRHHSAALGVALAAGLNAAAAEMNNTRTTTSSGTYSSTSGSGVYSGTSTTYDPLAASVARSNAASQNQQMADDVNQRFGQERSFWDASYLGKTTLRPGESTWGAIKFRFLGWSEAYEFHIPFPDGTRTVRFEHPPDL